MEMTHAFAYANFDSFLSLEVVPHALNFSIYICRCARQVLSLMAAVGDTDQVLAAVAAKRCQLLVTLTKCCHQLPEVMAIGNDISQVSAVASARCCQWHQPSFVTDGSWRQH